MTEMPDITKNTEDWSVLAPWCLDVDDLGELKMIPAHTLKINITPLEGDASRLDYRAEANEVEGDRFIEGLSNRVKGSFIVDTSTRKHPYDVALRVTQEITNYFIDQDTNILIYRLPPRMNILRRLGFEETPKTPMRWINDFTFAMKIIKDNTEKT